MNYFKHLKTRFKNSHQDLIKRLEKHQEDALDGLQRDADAFGIDIDVNASFLDLAYRFFIVTALICVILLNLGIDWSRIQSLAIVVLMVLCSVMAFVSHWLMNFAIKKESEYDDRGG